MAQAASIKVNRDDSAYNEQFGQTSSAADQDTRSSGLTTPTMAPSSTLARNLFSGAAPLGSSSWAGSFPSQLPSAASNLFTDPSYSYFSWPTGAEGFWSPANELWPGDLASVAASPFVTASDILPGAAASSLLPSAAASSMLMAADPFAGVGGVGGVGARGGLPFNAPSSDSWGNVWNRRLPSAGLLGAPGAGAVTAGDISKVFPRHVGSRVIYDENGNVIWRPAADIFETEEAIIVHVDLPGVPKSEINIDVRSTDLIIWGIHKAPYEAASSRVRERNIGKFRKIVTLPLEKVDTDKIEAKAENGLLEVTIAKKPTAKGKRITIE